MYVGLYLVPLKTKVDQDNARAASPRMQGCAGRSESWYSTILLHPETSQAKGNPSETYPIVHMRT